MSSTDDASSRLSNALDEILSGAGPTLPPRDGAAPPVAPVAPEPELDDAVAEPAVDWNVDDPTDEHDVYELPEIVPATNPVPLAAPVARTAPGPKPPHVSPPSAPTAPVAPQPSKPAAPAAPAAPTAPTSGWGDLMEPTGAQAAPLRAPGRRPRVRKVTRVLRHIDPWSTFKVALLFSAVAYVVLLTTGVLLWRVAVDTGTLDNVERWFTQFGWETFELKGGEIFHNAWIIGLFGVVAMTGGLVLLATLFNLVSDIVGGVRMTVLEEEVVERTVSSTRRYVVRRAPVGPEAAESQNWDVDSDEPVEASNESSADWSVDDDIDGDVDGDVDDAPDDDQGDGAGAATG